MTAAGVGQLFLANTFQEHEVIELEFDDEPVVMGMTCMCEDCVRHRAVRIPAAKKGVPTQ